ncbi:hypothetical protein ES332_D04G004200v1 [Gossypium tomentosum]|uniref:Protein kinase domain-containing protein n=1 Tax=Gossypium tomentosum TaxID=34277 RepID=A0A5D2LAQ1_GOSTO|nr:hypothetical protein ES332_D04G004200v1 [Gossypium tomentosum]
MSMKLFKARFTSGAHKLVRTMLIYSLFCFILAVNVAEAVPIQDDCKVQRCNHQDPPVRFPFRLEGQQSPHCGYPHPGFQLSCSENKQTLLRIPRSLKLLVKHIDYEAQRIDLYVPGRCLWKQLFYLNLSAFPFAEEQPGFSRLKVYRSQPAESNYTLFECSSQEKALYKKRYRVACLSTPGSQIIAFTSDDYYYGFNLLNCSYFGNFSTPISPYGIRFQLRWYKPDCGDCEAQGRGWDKVGYFDFSGHSGRRCHCRRPVKGAVADSQTLGRKSDCPKGLERVFEFLFLRKVKKMGNLKQNLVFIAPEKDAVLASFIWPQNDVVLPHNPREQTECFYIPKHHIGLGERLMVAVKIEKFLEDYKGFKPSRYSYADIKRITNHFKDKLGQGGYGTVFKGRLSSDVLVAIKVLNNFKGNGEEFINEVGSMGRIHHVNVTRLVGFCADGYDRALVYEYLPNESLEKLIFAAKGKDRSLSWEKLQDITVGVAKGIEYLHQGCEQRILHFDIKPHNILLDHNFNPKISDFGLAKLCSKEQSAISMTTARGTMGYIAPEVLSRNFGNVSYKSDVYSFGMLLLEMVGGRKNIDVTVENTSQEFGIRIEDDAQTGIAKKLMIVGLWCIQWYPVHRPSMKVVVQMLEGELGALTMPPNPFASTDPPKTMGATIPRKPAVNRDLPTISEME